MKLRLRGNSIRLRLTQTEVGILAAGAQVTDSTGLGPDRFLEFGVRPSTNERIEISATAHGFYVLVPQKTLSHWAAGDDEGFEADVRISDSETTRVTVQKDYACLKPRGEEDHDSFANPDSETQKC
jgi:hypothetical protein